MEVVRDVFPGVSFPANSAVAAARTTSSLRSTLGMITLAWVFGSVWSTVTTGAPLTLFAQKLGASNFQFGLLAALPFLASLMAVPGSLLIEWTGRRKSVFLVSLYLQRAMWFVIALYPVWAFNRRGPAGGALGAFLWLMLLMYAAGALGGPAWLGWMADIVPPRLNGKYFSRRRQWGIVTSAPAAIFVGWFLDHRVSNEAGIVLRWCALFFLASAACGLMDIHAFQYVPAAPRPPKKGRELLGALKEPLGRTEFLGYSGFIGMLTFAVNFLGQFSTLYLLEAVGVANMGVQMILVVTPMIAQLLVLGVWGRAADRVGKRPLLALASAGLVPVGVGWCFVNSHTLWLGYALSGLGAALWTGVEVANMNLVLENSRPSAGNSGGSSFAAVNSVMINVAGCLGGLAAGVIAQGLRDWRWTPAAGGHTFNFYDVLFVSSGLLRFAAVLSFLPLLRKSAAGCDAREHRQTRYPAKLPAPVSSAPEFADDEPLRFPSASPVADQPQAA